jgi:hypothetical protein
MRLQPIDEYPFHQHPAPFNVPATSDAKYNDGYWFAFYGPEWYFVSVIRLHPNVNAIDGAACVAHDGRQHAVRFSRALRPGATDLYTGALRLDIVEPMKRLRLSLGENPAGIRFDIEIAPQASPFVEERYQHYKYGAIVNDTIRYTQVCRATGEAALGRAGDRGRELARDPRPQLGHPLIDGAANPHRRRGAHRLRGRPPRDPPVGSVQGGRSLRLLQYPRGPRW